LPPDSRIVLPLSREPSPRRIPANGRLGDHDLARGCPRRSLKIDSSIAADETRAMENRTLPFAIKSVAETGMIEGVISAFDGVDAYGDTIERGAYAKSIERLRKEARKLPLLYQHDTHRPIGVWAELRESGEGLIGKADLAMEVRDAQEAHALARKGALTGISIGFDIAPGGYRKEGNRRILTDIILYEASLVTFPADPKARVTAVKRRIDSARDIAELLQEAGLSGRKAKLGAGAAWKAINEQSLNDDAAEAVLRQAIARLGQL
jgi:HK97 family phage prohead protease